MHIAPNNKLSNHYRKKKTRRTVWTEDQTVSSSFRQNMETMQEKTGIRMFYEDYLNPGVSFSNNGCPDLFGFCSDMPDNDVNIFSNSVMDAYDNNNSGMAGIEGINNVFGGDIKGIGNSNNVFVEDGVFSELTDNQNVDWTVMTDYKVNSETLTQEYTFKTELNNFDAGEVSSLTIGLSTGVSIPTLSWSGITYSRLVMNIGSQTYTNIESGWNSFEFIKSVDGLTWALGQAIGFDAEVKVTDVGGEITTITLHRDGLFDKAWDFLTEIWSQMAGAVTAAVDAVVSVLNTIWNWIVEQVTKLVTDALAPVTSMINSWVNSVQQVIDRVFERHSPSLAESDPAQAATEIITVLTGGLFTALMAVAIALEIASAVLNAMTFAGTSSALKLLVDKVVLMVLVTIAASLLTAGVADLISKAESGDSGGAFGFVTDKLKESGWGDLGLIIAVGGVIAAFWKWSAGKFVIGRSCYGFALAILGLIINIANLDILSNIVGLAFSVIGLILIISESGVMKFIKGFASSVESIAATSAVIYDAINVGIGD